MGVLGAQSECFLSNLEGKALFATGFKGRGKCFPSWNLARVKWSLKKVRKGIVSGPSVLRSDVFQEPIPGSPAAL